MFVVVNVLAAAAVVVAVVVAGAGGETDQNDLIILTFLLNLKWVEKWELTFLRIQCVKEHKPFWREENPVILENFDDPVEKREMS